MQIGFLKGDEVEFHHFQELKELHEKGVISRDEKVINPMVQTKEEFDKGFVQAFLESPFS